MADLKQLKISRQPEHDVADPIAELTRIMGLAPQSAPDTDDFDDFGIDLEAELMGAFDASEFAAPLAANAPGPHAGTGRAPAGEPAPVIAFPPLFGRAAGQPEEEALDGENADRALAPAGPQPSRPSIFDILQERAPAPEPEAAPAEAEPQTGFSAASEVEPGVESEVEPVAPAGKPAVIDLPDFADNLAGAGYDDGMVDALADQDEAGEAAVPDPVVAVAGPAPRPAASILTTADAIKAFDPFAELAAMSAAVSARAAVEPEPAPPAPEPSARAPEPAPKVSRPASPVAGPVARKAEPVERKAEPVPAARAAAPAPVAPEPVARAAEPRPIAAEPAPRAMERPLSRATPVAPAPVAPAFRETFAPRAAAPAPDAPVFARPDFARPDFANPVVAREEPPVAAAPVAPASDDIDRALDEMMGAFAADISSHGHADPAAGEAPGPMSASGWQFDGPEIETVDVPEFAVEPAEDIDLPELVFHDDVPPAPVADELELQFASAFEELSAAPGARAAAPARPAADAFFDDAAFAADRPFPAGSRAYAPEPERWRPDDVAVEPAEPAWAAEDDTYAYDEATAQPFPHGDAAEAPRGRRRGLAVAAIVAGIAVIGGVAAFVMMRDGGAGSEPALVRADTAPVKVRPETPGGVTVPNQDKAVYDRIAGATEEAPPAQETLVSTREEPVEIAVREVAPIAEETTGEVALPEAVAKAEDRVLPGVGQEPAATAPETPAVAPRRVRTMIVRPDGTLVPREEAEPAAPAAPVEVARAAEPVPAPAPAPAAELRTGPAAPEPVAAPAPVVAEPEPAETAAIEPAAPVEVAAAEVPPVRVVETQTIKPGDTPSQRMPARGPVAPARPSEQPVAIVGNTTRANPPAQVAAVQPPPAPAAAATGEWAMQIASQPTPEGAQASYVDLARRYGSVLGGRGVSIVKADIPGKGTFYRVRIPAQNRADAVALCERFKAAGGSCFVAK